MSSGSRGKAMVRVVAGRLALVVVLLATASSARAGDWSDSYESIRGACQGVQTIEAEFVQTRALKILRQPIVSRGTFTYRRPADLRWAYVSPIESVFVTHSGTAERFLRREGKLIRDASARVDAMGAVLAEINLWLSGNFAQSKLFVPEIQHSAGKAAVVLVPIAPALGATIKNIRLTLGRAPGTLDRIVIDEGTEGTTSIDFTNLRINVALGTDRFDP